MIEPYRPGCTILYVEDDNESRDELLLFLRRRCGKLLVAANGEEGFDQFMRETPDVIITDIQMPVMNGLEMIKKIRESGSDVPVLVTSAFNEQRYLSEADDVGVNDYTLKPINLMELDKKVAALFGILK